MELDYRATAAGVLQGLFGVGAVGELSCSRDKTKYDATSDRQRLQAKQMIYASLYPRGAPSKVNSIFLGRKRDLGKNKCRTRTVCITKPARHRKTHNLTA